MAKNQKKDLMNEIDQALLVESHRKKIKREIAKGMKQFKIPNVINKKT